MGEDRDFRVGDRIIYRDGEYHGVVVKLVDHERVETKWDDCGWESNNIDPIRLISHDTDIKVGDRIRVTGTRCFPEHIGEYGVVEEINRNYQPYSYHVRYDGHNGKLVLWSTGIKVSNDTPLTKDNMKGEGDKMDNEQVTRDGYVYTKLKSLSPESVLKGNPCKGEFAKYVETAVYDGLSFYDDWPLNQLFSHEYFTKYPAWLPWLISHGYILLWKEEVKKEKVKKVIVFPDAWWDQPPWSNVPEMYNYGMEEERNSLQGKKHTKVTIEWEE